MAVRKPRVLFTRSQARGKKARIFSLQKKRNELINVHKTFEDDIRARSRKSGSIFKVFETPIDESPVMPAAMGMGAVLGKTVTFQQKYPERLGEQVVAFKDEVLEALQ